MPLRAKRQHTEAENSKDSLPYSLARVGVGETLALFFVIVVLVFVGFCVLAFVLFGFLWDLPMVLLLETQG